MQAVVPCNVPRITVASVLRANKSGIMLAKPKTLRDDGIVPIELLLEAPAASSCPVQNGFQVAVGVNLR